MPVRLEHIHTPTDADWTDLGKIHNETSASGLSADRDALTGFLASGGWIMAGRFNDRIIGVVLARKDNNSIVLSQAAVRTITQRRGVMHQLLHFIQRYAAEQQLSLRVDNCPQELESALEHRQFAQIGTTWMYNPI